MADPTRQITNTPHILNETVTSTWYLMPLGGNPLTDALYFLTTPQYDEFGRCMKQGSAHDVINGDTIVQVFDKTLKGAPLTITMDGDNGCLTAGTAASLVSLRDAGTDLVFYDGATSIQCMFDFAIENPLDLHYLDANKKIVVGTIHLRRIA